MAAIVQIIFRLQIESASAFGLGLRYIIILAVTRWTDRSGRHRISCTTTLVARFSCARATKETGAQVFPQNRLRKRYRGKDNSKLRLELAEAEQNRMIVCNVQTFDLIGPSKADNVESDNSVKGERCQQGKLGKLSLEELTKSQARTWHRCQPSFGCSCSGSKEWGWEVQQWWHPWAR